MGRSLDSVVRGAGPALASECLALADVVTTQAPPAVNNCQVGIRRWVFAKTGCDKEVVSGLELYKSAQVTNVGGFCGLV